MFTIIHDVLDSHQLHEVRALLSTAKYIDGGVTAGEHALKVKHNDQVKCDDLSGSNAQNLVMPAIINNDSFQAHSFMKEIGYPIFSKYEVGMKYGPHNDNPLMAGPSGVFRCDMAMTLFLNQPSEYEGGELCVKGTQHKLPAGSMLLYPADTVHSVAEVTGGIRHVMVNWCQSFIRNPGHRQMLVDLQEARTKHSFEKINDVYTKLVREWADV